MICRSLLGIVSFQHPLGCGQAKYFLLIPPPETSEDMLAPGTGIRTIAIPDAFVKVDIVLDAELRLAPDQKAEIVHRLDILEVNNYTGSSDTVQSFTPPGRSSEIESVMNILSSGCWIQLAVAYLLAHHLSH